MFEEDFWLEDLTGEYDLNKLYEQNLKPDTSGNKWFDKPYVKRWDTPEANKYLTDNASILAQKARTIQAAAEKGDFRPYFKHQAELKKLGLIPADAEKIGSTLDKWLKSKNLYSDKGGGLDLHDAFSHAYPEKYLGPVDPTPLGRSSVTGAEEARASMFDDLIDEDGVRDRYRNIEAGDGASLQDLKDSVEKTGTWKLDAGQEAKWYRKQYLKDLQDKAQTSTDPAYKGPYGTTLDPDYDPLVGGVYDDTNRGVKSINKSFLEGAEARYPQMDSDMANKIIDEALIPYARDVDISQKLQLYKNLFNIDPDTGIKNSYFATTPIGIASDLVKKNWKGGMGGAGWSLLAPEVAQKVDANDWQGAGTAFGRDVLGGAIAEQGIKLGSQGLLKVAPQTAIKAAPYISGTMNVAGPTLLGAGIFAQGRDNSLTNIAIERAANYVPGLQSNPETDLGKRSWDFLRNKGKQFFNLGR